MQVWLMLNPKGLSNIDSQIVLEFMKLIYDPYAGQNNQNQVKLVSEFLRAIKNMHSGNDVIIEEDEYDTVQQQERE